MRWLLVVVMGMIATSGLGESLRLLSLDRMAMRYARIADYHDSYFADVEHEQWFGHVSAQWDLSLLRYGDYGLYWHNNVHGESTKQFRQVGWQYELGIQLGRKLSVYWEHHSRHLLDATSADRFPLTNTYGLEITFYERRN